MTISFHRFVDQVSVILFILVTVWALRFLNNQTSLHLYEDTQCKYAIIGDIGGTNIRFQTVKLNLNIKNHIQVINYMRLKVKDYDTFEQSLLKFTQSIQIPNIEIAVIAIAGPIYQNSAELSNVKKWGTLSGKELGKLFNIKEFKLINDFQAISYGLLIVGDHQITSLNQKNIEKEKLTGVIGPGTGLGHSIIFNHQQGRTIVFPSQAGHSDFPLIDQTSWEYFSFLKRTMNLSYITLEKSFCGPTITHMFQFISAVKNNQYIWNLNQTSESIIAHCLQFPNLVYKQTCNLLLKYYQSAIGNFLIQHLPQGGIYLVGSLTRSLFPLMQRKTFMKQWNDRHPQMAKVIERIPIVFCNEVDLGLRGAYVIANKINMQLLKKSKEKLGI